MVEAVAANRARQRELYGAPLGDRVRRLTTRLGISQARLAKTLGISPAMLSQLVSARRVKIGDPAVLARLRTLDRRCTTPFPVGDRREVDKLLNAVARMEWDWTGGRGAEPPLNAAQALRRVAEPGRLAAAAAALGGAFPEVAEVLRQASRADGPAPAA
ncbi:MAG TPA: helix-turn-helix transcriptional regulator [Pseudonocardia sp.]